jgi:hypothetical protein
MKRRSKSRGKKASIWRENRDDAVSEMLPPKLVGEFVDAAVLDQAKALRMLRKYPGLRNARWFGEETVLHFLAIENYKDAVRFLCEHGFDVNTADGGGEVPIIHVTMCGYTDIAAILLEHGADPNARSIVGNALHIAAESGNAPLVDLLIKKGARTDYVTDLQETVFDALPSNEAKRRAVLSVLKKHRITPPNER